MDLLLAHTYYLRLDAQEMRSPRPYPPLGLLHLTSHLRAHGVRVGLFDSTFADPADFAVRLRHERPSAVGLYVNMHTRPQALAMLRTAKAQGLPVIVGGPEPVNYAEKYLQRGADVVVVGEGELTLQELLPALQQHGPHALHHVLGIVFQQDDGAIVRTAPRPFISDLDAQPLAARGDVDMPTYLQTWRDAHGASSLAFLTARGCPYRCGFCSRSVFGRSHRRRGAESMAQEIEQEVATYKPDRIWFADDVFTLNKRALGELARALKTRGLRVPFETISREDRLDEEVIRLLADMGCYRLWVGAESGSQRLLDRMQRDTNALRTVAMVHLLQKHGIQAGMFIMWGYDGETVDDVHETGRILRRAKPDALLTTVAYPVKGTPLFEAAGSRVRTAHDWETSGDNQNGIAGRLSPDFYRQATRWLVHEVEAAKAKPVRSLRHRAQAALGKARMRGLAHEIET